VVGGRRKKKGYVLKLRVGPRLTTLRGGGKKKRRREIKNRPAKANREKKKRRETLPLVPVRFDKERREKRKKDRGKRTAAATD